MAGEPFQVVYRHRSGASHTVDGLRSAWEADVIRDVLSIKEALDAGEDLGRLKLRNGLGLPWPALAAKAQRSPAVASLLFAHLVQQLQRCVDRTRQETVTYFKEDVRAFNLLHAAAACQHKEAALLLLAAAPIMARQRDGQGRMALHFVAELGWTDVVAPLMMAAPEAATSHDDSRATPLVAAHRRRQIGAARALMSATLSSPSASTLLGSMMLDTLEENNGKEFAALAWIAAESGADSGGAASLLDKVLSDIGPSLLHEALDNFDANSTRLLVEAAPWLATQRDDDGQAALHLLVELWLQYVHEEDVMQPVYEPAEALLAVPGTATAVDNQGRTALFLVVSDLYDEVADSDEEDSYGDAINLLKLLGAAAPATVALPAAAGETPVHLAVCAGVPAMRALLDAAPEQVAATVTAATGQQTPLQLAVKRRRWTAVAQLLDAVMQASCTSGQDGSAAAWQLLLEAARSPAALAQVDEYGSTLLHAAAVRPTAAVLRLLLSEQVGDVMAANYDGRVPLHAAAKRGSTDCVRLLLATAPAAAMVADHEGALPLHRAAGSGRAEAVKLLLEAAPQAATTGDSERWLPLHMAAHFGQSTAVQLLLEAAPATVSSRTRALETALVLALISWKADAAAILLTRGSTQEGLTALSAEAQPPLHHLYAVLVAAQLPLSAAEWALVPSPCHRLGRALPPALQHSAEQAQQLVCRLPARDAERLQVAALALARVQRRLRVHLHGALVGRILSLALP